MMWDLDTHRQQEQYWKECWHLYFGWSQAWKPDCYYRPSVRVWNIRDSSERVRRGVNQPQYDFTSVKTVSWELPGRTRSSSSIIYPLHHLFVALRPLWGADSYDIQRGETRANRSKDSHSWWVNKHTVTSLVEALLTSRWGMCDSAFVHTLPALLITRINMTSEVLLFEMWLTLLDHRRSTEPAGPSPTSGNQSLSSLRLLSSSQLLYIFLICSLKLCCLSLGFKLY